MTKKFKQLTEAQWTKGHYEPVAVMEVAWKDLEKRLGATFVHWDEDGLGASCGGFFTTADGVQFIIAHRKEHSPPYANFECAIQNPNDKPEKWQFRPEHLEDVLLATVIESTELSWTHDSFKFVEHEVWRQDDNGNKFMVKKVPCRADAVITVDRMTASGHKQTYWMQPAK